MECLGLGPSGPILPKHMRPFDQAMQHYATLHIKFMQHYASLHIITTPRIWPCLYPFAQCGKKCRESPVSGFSIFGDRVSCCFHILGWEGIVDFVRFVFLVCLGISCVLHFHSKIFRDGLFAVQCSLSLICVGSPLISSG